MATLSYTADDAYLVGILDGEGTVGVYHYESPKESKTIVSVAVQMCERGPLEKLRTRFGGTIGAPRRHSDPFNERHRPISSWKIVNEKARPALELLRDFSFTTKRQQANLALEALTYIARARERCRTKGLHPSKRKLTLFPEELLQRKALANAVAALKRVSDNGLAHIH